jgi:hypothetical protein
MNCTIESAAEARAARAGGERGPGTRTPNLSRTNGCDVEALHAVLDRNETIAVTVGARVLSSESLFVHRGDV